MVSDVEVSFIAIEVRSVMEKLPEQPQVVVCTVVFTAVSIVVSEVELVALAASVEPLVAVVAAEEQTSAAPA